MDASLQRDGFVIVRGVAAPAGVDSLVASLERGAGGRTSQRNVLSLPGVARFAASDAAVGLVRPVLGERPVVVRGILFDKTGEANWRVGWHQDRIIPVAGRRDTPGFTAWSVKQGVVHVQPPVGVLERMATVRLHLDPCPAENGPLEVLPGSHGRGLLSGEQIAELRAAGEPVTCTADAGDALVMRPLLLHASAKAASAGRRRVLHLEYAAGPLPGSLEWPSWSRDEPSQD